MLVFPKIAWSIDLSIARGLDYYTGTVYETLLGDLPAIGSVCSGGRYDDLAGLYTKQHLPGVGASLGLDRLMAAMEGLGLLQDAATSADVFIVQFSAEALPSYIALARRLRQAGLRTELYPEAKGMGSATQIRRPQGLSHRPDWRPGRIGEGRLAGERHARWIER